jgi:hypothetical protein
VERDVTANKALLDTSYAGIGGWTPWPFLLMWRITHDEMDFLGFSMKQIQAIIDELTTVDAEGLHINPLKFVAALWSTCGPSFGSTVASPLLLLATFSHFSRTLRRPFYGCVLLQ